MKAESDAHPFWRFSLDRYGRDCVSPLCLQAQETYGADVNLVLFGLWLGSEGSLLTAQGAENAASAVADWHRNIVVPMRGVRRWMKTCPTDDPVARDRLRTAIQKYEIEAERMEQDSLYRFYRASGPADLLPVKPGIDTMVTNAAFFCGDGAHPVLEDLARRCL